MFSHDVTVAILVSQKNETAFRLVSQTSPLGVELFSYANAFFCYNKFGFEISHIAMRCRRVEFSAAQFFALGGLEMN